MANADKIFGRSFGEFELKGEVTPQDGGVSFQVRMIKYGDEATDFTKVNYNPTQHGEADQMRWSIAGPGGGKYVLTRWVGDGGGWENPHLHRGLVERYHCIAGEVKVLWVEDGKAELKELVVGGDFVVPTGSPHIVWMSQGAETHTLAVGEPGKDWHGVKEFSDADRDALKEKLDSLD